MLSVRSKYHGMQKMRGVLPGDSTPAQQPHKKKFGVLPGKGVDNLILSMNLVWIPSVCPHLLDNNTCNIYENRPKQCRLYPTRTPGLVVPPVVHLKNKFLWVIYQLPSLNFFISYDDFFKKIM